MSVFKQASQYRDLPESIREVVRRLKGDPELPVCIYPNGLFLPYTYHDRTLQTEWCEIELNKLGHDRHGNWQIDFTSPVKDIPFIGGEMIIIFGGVYDHYGARRKAYLESDIVTTQRNIHYYKHYHWGITKPEVML